MKKILTNKNYGHGKRVRLSEKEAHYVAPLVEVLLGAADGKDRAIKSEAMARWINSTRSLQYAKAHTCPTRVRYIIRSLRAEGRLPFLVASKRGYYVATDIGEVRRYISQLKSRASEVRRIALRMEAALHEIETKGALIQKRA